jgi:hypothetical protein
MTNFTVGMPTLGRSRSAHSQCDALGWGRLVVSNLEYHGAFKLRAALVPSIRSVRS